jgi:hypothetical protein
MRAKTLLLVILLFGNLQAMERPQETIQISAVLEEVKEVEPDIFRFPLSLSVKVGRERDAVNILGEVDRAIRELSFKYSGVLSKLSDRQRHSVRLCDRKKSFRF